VLKLGKVAPGNYRPLTPAEVQRLYRMVHLDEK
jgi:hypothetical protein